MRAAERRNRTRCAAPFGLSLRCCSRELLVPERSSILERSPHPRAVLHPASHRLPVPPGHSIAPHNASSMGHDGLSIPHARTRSFSARPIPQNPLPARTALPSLCAPPRPALGPVRRQTTVPVQRLWTHVQRPHRDAPRLPQAPSTLARVLPHGPHDTDSPHRRSRARDPSQYELSLAASSARRSACGRFGGTEWPRQRRHRLACALGKRLAAPAPTAQKETIRGVRVGN